MFTVKHVATNGSVSLYSGDNVTAMISEMMEVRHEGDPWFSVCVYSGEECTRDVPVYAGEVVYVMNDQGKTVDIYRAAFTDRIN